MTSPILTASEARDALIERLRKALIEYGDHKNDCCRSVAKRGRVPFGIGARDEYYAQLRKCDC